MKLPIRELYRIRRRGGGEEEEDDAVETEIHKNNNMGTR